MRVLVCPSDSFAGTCLCDELEREGHDVIRVCDDGPLKTSGLSSFEPSGTTLDVNKHWSEVEASLRAADAIVCELATHHATALKLAAAIARLPARIEPCKFVAISTPLVWARTPATTPAQKNGPQHGSGEDIDEDHLDPASEIGAGRHVASASEARVPSLTAVDVWKAELALVHRHVPGRLLTYVVCPGLLYGRGEWDAGFHAWFSSAWKGDDTTPLLVHGRGSNYLPTIHVADLAVYVKAVIASRPSRQYLLAVDDAGSTQREIAAAISSRLGSGELYCSDDASLFYTQVEEQLLLDVRFERTHVDGASLAFPGGIVQHMPALAEEFIAARSLRPLRLVICGPPASGKSALARHIGQQYSLPVIAARDILAGASSLTAEQKKTVDPKAGGRLPPDVMSVLCRKALTNVRVRNRGYVLDGFPKTLIEARQLFTSPRDWTSDELESQAKSAASTGKDAKKQPGKDDKKSKAPVLDDVPEPRALARELFPDALVMLYAGEKELFQRCSIAAIKEQDESQQTEVKLWPGGKSHNNVIDFVRRLNAFKALRELDQADLARKSVEKQEQWAQEQAAAEERQKQRDAALEAVKRHRKRQRAPAPAAAGPLPGQSAEAASSKPALTEPGTGGVETDVAGVVSPSSETMAAEEQPSESTPVPGPLMPTHGGFVGFFKNAGCTVVELRASLREASPAEDAEFAIQLAAKAVAAGKEASKSKGKSEAPPADPETLPPAKEYLTSEFECLEMLSTALRQAVGEPRNFEGLQPVTLHIPVPEQELQLQHELAAARAAKQAEVRDRVATVVAQREAMTAEAAAADEAIMQRYVQVIKQELMREVMPAIASAVLELVRVRPEDAVGFLAEALIAKADAQDAAAFDPYDAPIYEERRQKVAAKAAREAQRAHEDLLKAERQRVARAQADQNLYTLLANSVAKHESLLRRPS